MRSCRMFSSTAEAAMLSSTRLNSPASGCCCWSCELYESRRFWFLKILVEISELSKILQAEHKGCDKLPVDGPIIL